MRARPAAINPRARPGWAPRRAAHRPARAPAPTVAVSRNDPSSRWRAMRRASVPSSPLQVAHDALDGRLVGLRALAAMRAPACRGLLAHDLHQGMGVGQPRAETRGLRLESGGQLDLVPAQDDGVPHALAALQQVAQLALGAGVSDAGWKSGSRWTPRWLPPRMAASVVPAPGGTLTGSSGSRSIRRWPSVIDYLNMTRHTRGNDCRKSSTTLCSFCVSITIRGVSARISAARSCRPLICENRVKATPSIAERGVVRGPGSCRLSRDLARRCTLAVRF